MSERLSHLINDDYSVSLPDTRRKHPKVVVDHSDPVYVYLKSLPSTKSRQTAFYVLNTVARHLGMKSHHQIVWTKFTRPLLLELIGVLTHENASGKTLAPTTVRNYVSIVKGVCREAFLLELISPASWERLRLTKPPKGSRIKQHHILSVERYETLIQDCANDTKPAGKRDLAIFALLVGCGLRRHEVVGLDREDILFGRRKVRVIGKGDKERLVDLHSSVEDYIGCYLEEVRGDMPGPLFFSIRKSGEMSDKRLSESGIYHICKQRGLLTDVDRIPPHSLRRTFATWLYHKGMPLKKIQELLGHEKITTTQNYIIDGKSDYDERIELLPL